MDGLGMRFVKVHLVPKVPEDAVVFGPLEYKIPERLLRLTKAIKEAELIPLVWTGEEFVVERDGKYYISFDVLLGNGKPGVMVVDVGEDF